MLGLNIISGHCLNLFIRFLHIIILIYFTCYCFHVPWSFSEFEKKNIRKIKIVWVIIHIIHYMFVRACICVCVCVINCTYVRKNSRKKCNKCIYCIMAVPSLEQDFSPPGSWNYFGNWWICSAKVSFRYLQTLEETLSPRWPTNNLKKSPYDSFHNSLLRVLILVLTVV